MSLKREHGCPIASCLHLDAFTAFSFAELAWKVTSAAAFDKYTPFLLLLWATEGEHRFDWKNNNNISVTCIHPQYSTIFFCEQKAFKLLLLLFYTQHGYVPLLLLMETVRCKVTLNRCCSLGAKKLVSHNWFWSLSPFYQYGWL